MGKIGILERITVCGGFRKQGKIREQLSQTWSADPIKSMEEQTKRNMAVFGEAMRVFNPFAAAATGAAAKPAESAAAAQKDDLQSMKDQLSAMQRQLESLANRK